MNSISNSASIVFIASIMAFSSMTTTPSIPIDPLSPIYRAQESKDDYATETIKTFEISSPKRTNYEEARMLYQGEMRDFSPSELAQYRDSIRKLFKPTGLNVFDLC